MIIEREFFTTQELENKKSGAFLSDVEIYPNYFLAAFKDYETGKIAYFEAIDDEPIPVEWLYFMLSSFCMIGFNYLRFDLVILSMSLNPLLTVADLKSAADRIIIDGTSIAELEMKFGFTMFKANAVDLIEVAPLRGSLKVYGARLHCQHMQDLPYDPGQVLTREEIAQVRTYCFNDLDNTGLLCKELEPHLTLRYKLSEEFNKDLRSLSDAQLAQEIINTEIARVTGKRPKRPGFEQLVGKSFRYVAPSYVTFNNPMLQTLLTEIQASDIVIDQSGHVICPKSIDGRRIEIAGREYTIGMGGLHSNEKEQALIKTDNMRILDRDVTGYYPNLILKNGFAPAHLGDAFLQALQNIVDKRYAAKKSGDKITADSLKIASNGTFGKTSDPYSTIYSPSMMVQTTLTGQLSLLMAIEMLTAHDYKVVSANTDGIVTLCPHCDYAGFWGLFEEWEQRTNLETEETEYAALYSKDVNNYIAIKMDGKHKAKGIYSEFGSALNSPLSKNPTCFVVMDAVVAYLTQGVPVAETVTACLDIRRFVIVRAVKGGAQRDGRYLGKVIRWYYATGVIGAIHDCIRGAKVSLSDGGKPLMTLPPIMPHDVDYQRYIAMAIETLEDVGRLERRNQQLKLFNA